MLTRDEFRKQAQQLAKMLANQKIRTLAGFGNRFLVDENLYHVSQAPDMTPDRTDIGMTVKSKVGALHMFFNYGDSLIYISQPHPQAGHDPLYTTDLRAVVRRAPEIVASATKVEFHGNVTPDLWDGAFRPLNSQEALRYWAQPQDHQQPGSDADGDDMMVL